VTEEGKKNTEIVSRSAESGPPEEKARDDGEEDRRKDRDEQEAEEQKAVCGKRQ